MNRVTHLVNIFSVASSVLSVAKPLEIISVNASLVHIIGMPVPGAAEAAVFISNGISAVVETSSVVSAKSLMKLFFNPRNGECKNKNENNEEEDDGAKGGGEDVQLRLQVKHPGHHLVLIDGELLVQDGDIVGDHTR